METEAGARYRALAAARIVPEGIHCEVCGEPMGGGSRYIRERDTGWAHVFCSYECWMLRRRTPIQ